MSRKIITQIFGNSPYNIYYEFHGYLWKILMIKYSSGFCNVTISPNFVQRLDTVCDFIFLWDFFQNFHWELRNPNIFSPTKAQNDHKYWEKIKMVRFRPIFDKNRNIFSSKPFPIYYKFLKKLEKWCYHFELYDIAFIQNAEI